MLDPETRDLARLVVVEARQRGVMIATAESCTGGLIAAALTDIPGASEMLDRGVVTYSNAAKIELLGVPETVLARHGAVSEATACAMAEGALARSVADLAVAVTGIAGPGGGSIRKPVGRVYLAIGQRGAPTMCAQLDFPDLDRAGVRAATTHRALEGLRDALRAWAFPSDQDEEMAERG